jgi:uncharacterized protein with von Willebrand factor type A (vWA) domain
MGPTDMQEILDKLIDLSKERDINKKITDFTAKNKLPKDGDPITLKSIVELANNSRLSDPTIENLKKDIKKELKEELENALNIDWHKEDLEEDKDLKENDGGLDWSKYQKQVKKNAKEFIRKEIKKSSSPVEEANKSHLKAIKDIADSVEKFKDLTKKVEILERGVEEFKNQTQKFSRYHTPFPITGFFPFPSYTATSDFVRELVNVGAVDPKDFIRTVDKCEKWTELDHIAILY